MEEMMKKKRGRKAGILTKDPKEKFTEQIGIMLTKEQRIELEARLANTNKCISVYIREILFPNQLEQHIGEIKRAK